MAMEFVEGVTLREKMKSGLLPIRRFSTSQRQSPKASPNTMRHHASRSQTRQRYGHADGLVKILDFGLAKLIAPAPAQPRRRISHRDGPDVAGRRCRHPLVHVPRTSRRRSHRFSRRSIRARPCPLRTRHRPPSISSPHRRGNTRRHHARPARADRRSPARRSRAVLLGHRAMPAERSFASFRRNSRTRPRTRRDPRMLSGISRTPTRNSPRNASRRAQWIRRPREGSGSRARPTFPCRRSLGNHHRPRWHRKDASHRRSRQRLGRSLSRWRSFRATLAAYRPKFDSVRNRPGPRHPRDR